MLACVNPVFGFAVWFWVTASVIHDAISLESIGPLGKAAQCGSRARARRDARLSRVDAWAQWMGVDGGWMGGGGGWLGSAVDHILAGSDRIVETKKN